MLTRRSLYDVRTLHGSNGLRVSRSMMVASSTFLVLFAIVLVLVPLRRQMVEKVELPRWTREVILEPMPEPLPPAPPSIDQLTVQDIVEIPVPPGYQEPLPPARSRRETELDPDLGKQGRERAQEAVAELASATSALDGALDDLSSALRSSNASNEPASRRRQRNVRTGRSDGELGAFAGSASSGTSTDLGSTVQSAPVAIGSLAAPREEEGGAADSRHGGAAPGVYRSNASLLAVIQKYSAGIQYCYSNELKRDPSLTGKLVVTLTVAASGEVLEATVIRNTVGSSRLADCALTQIIKWRFPAIPDGMTTFQVPFVFTPPN